VNFDDSRARAAAEVLMEFVADQPRERQMLVLTCHAHVASIFHDVGASVRSLSGASLPPPPVTAAPVKAAEPETVRVEVSRPQPVAPPPPPVDPAPRTRIVIEHLAPAAVVSHQPPAAVPVAPPPPPLPAPPRAAMAMTRHSQGGLGYPFHGSHRAPAHTVIHSGHLAGLGYVGYVTAPSATGPAAATFPTSVGTTPVPRVGHGRTSHPHMEMVAGMIQQSHANDDFDTADDHHDDDEADTGRQRRQTKPAAPKPASQKPAARGKRSRGRGA
jgi:hypothetical protein